MNCLYIKGGFIFKGLFFLVKSAVAEHSFETGFKFRNFAFHSFIP